MRCWNLIQTPITIRTIKSPRTEIKMRAKERDVPNARNNPTIPRSYTNDLHRPIIIDREIAVLVRCPIRSTTTIDITAASTSASTVDARFGRRVAADEASAGGGVDGGWEVVVTVAVGGVGGGIRKREYSVGFLEVVFDGLKTRGAGDGG